MIEIHGEVARLHMPRGYVALIDAADAGLVAPYHWCVLVNSRTTYVTGNVAGKKARLHRFLLSAPPQVFVDHRNHDGLDNRRANLRIASRAENNRNSRAYLNAKSKYKGVVWAGDINRYPRPWRASITSDGKRFSLGYFETQEEAALAYDKAAKQFFGEFACLNFPCVRKFASLHGSHSEPWRFPDVEKTFPRAGNASRT